jgi:hypothetical protein
MATENQVREYYTTIEVEERDVHRLADEIRHAVTDHGRTRRRLAVVSGAALAVSAAAAAVGIGLAADRNDSPASHHPNRTQATTHGPADARTSESPPVALKHKTPQEIVNIFRALLPKQWTVVSTNASELPDDAYYVNIVINDGHGPALVSVAVNYRTPWETPVGCMDDTPPPSASATCTETSNGNQVLTDKTYEYPAAPSRGAREWVAEVWRPIQVAVDIHEWNSPSEKDAATTRAEPPLSLAEMTDIAENPAWTA